MSKIKKISIALAGLASLFPAIAGALTIDPGIPAELPGGTIYGIIANIVYWLLGIFAFFGVIGFVVAGIMYLVSAGNDEMIQKAKRYMMYSIVGVIVGLMGLVILQAAVALLGASSVEF